MTKAEFAKICIDIEGASVRLCVMLAANGIPQVAKLIENFSTEIIETLGGYVKDGEQHE